MVSTDMYGKSPYGSGYMELRENMTFLIINFYNFDIFLLSTIVLSFAEILF